MSGSGADSDGYTRLSVNLAAESATVLRDLVRRRRVTITEGIRRAIAVWKFIEDEQDKGNRIAVIEEDGEGKTSIREVVLLS
ncbi:hypothetical protein [Flindersiella endophytica]